MNIVLNGFFECVHILSSQQQVLDVRVISVHLKADNLFFLHGIYVIEIFTITDELSQYAQAEWQGGNNDQVRLLCLLGLLFGIDFTINDATFCPAVLVGLDTVLNSEILTRCNVSSAAGFSFEQLQLTTAPVFYQLIAVTGIGVYPVRHECSDQPWFVLFVWCENVLNRPNHFPLSIQAEFGSRGYIVPCHKQAMEICIALIQ